MRPVVAGNWKMNHGPRAARAFLETFEAMLSGAEVPILVFPPVISLAAARAALGSETRVDLGVQNIHPEPSGAFTGEISAEMAAEAGAAYALVGHSERRHRFGETDEETRQKARAAHRAGLVPVLCVGETKRERDEGRLAEVILRQLDAVLDGASWESPESESVRILLAYEPVWAIGTGDTATPDDASQAHTILRRRLADLMGADAARQIPILYGGSAGPGNAAGLLAAPEVDGLLVGGASLEPESFYGIVAAAANFG